MRTWLPKLQEWFGRRGYPLGVVTAYVGLLALFVVTLAQFYIPGKGFTYLIAFGANQEEGRLSKVRKLDYYMARGSDGYDAQYYAQIAMDPSLQNRELRRAVDSLPYRARRILFSATAYVFGLGKPAWILQAYALQIVACWFALAALLLHWFPARSWDNFARWAGTMFSFGLCMSLRNALIDGPSLLLIAFGVYLLERGRPWWSTAVFALGGLGKETNVLGAAALAPKFSDGAKAWGLAIIRGLLVATPLVLWVGYIAMTVGPAADPGLRNFDLPFAAYLRKWREIWDGWSDLSVANAGPLWSLLMMVALTAQFLYLVLRPQWSRAWWRIGFSYALLLVVLGDAVWEGYPGAASRVLLPMQLAFNVLVPAGRGWWAVLLLGNLTFFAAPSVLQTPNGEGYAVKGPDTLVYGRAGRMVTVEYGEGWYAPERHNADYWCWATGNGSLTLDNPHPAPLLVRVRFTLNLVQERRVRLLLNGSEVWSTSVRNSGAVSAALNEVVLRPGKNHWEFTTDAPAVKVGADPRPLAFSLQNLRIDVQRLQP